jgi:DNA-binding beta-propeller fold protein YncE
LAQPSSSVRPSDGGIARQPTRLTRRRLLLALLVVFVAGMVAAVLDLRFVIGGAPRRVEPNSLLVLDATTMKSLRNVKGATGPAAPAVVRGAGLVWTLDSDHNKLFGTNPIDGRVVRTETVGIEPVAVAVGFGDAWVANAGNASVTLVPLVGDKVETIGLSDLPSAIATGSGYVWVLSKLSGKVIRIDPKTKTVTKIVRLANPPLAVRAAGGRVRLAIGD